MLLCNSESVEGQGGCYSIKSSSSLSVDAHATTERTIEEDTDWFWTTFVGMEYTQWKNCVWLN